MTYKKSKLERNILAELLNCKDFCEEFQCLTNNTRKMVVKTVQLQKIEIIHKELIKNTFFWPVNTFFRMLVLQKLIEHPNIWCFKICFYSKLINLTSLFQLFSKICNKKHIGWVHEFMKQDFQEFTFSFECWATLDGLDKWISGCSLRGMSSPQELCTIKVVVAQWIGL